jgi:hypothetical protein
MKVIFVPNTSQWLEKEIKFPEAASCVENWPTPKTY